MSSFEILDAGLLTTVQDLGRYGYQRYGVSQSGVMDTFSARIANELVGNLKEDALLEMTLKGATIKFLQEMVIAITGAQCEAYINDKKIELWRSYKVYCGDKLKIGFIKDGLRSYLSFSGGIDVPLIMGSRSTNLKANIGGFEGRKLKIGDEIRVFSKNIQILKKLKPEIIPRYEKEREIGVILGQQENCFSEEGKETFFTSEYTVKSESDRMGIRVSGNKIDHIESADIISDGITFGAIQIPGSGQPIIMMADRQTIGGYTKIGNVISSDLSKLSQAIPGDILRFKKVELEEAVNKIKEEEELINNKDSYVVITEENINKLYMVVINNHIYNIEIEEILD